MPRVEILVEERSIKEVMRNILPKILSDKWKLDENYFIREHEGKSDLRSSIEKKVKVFSNWHEPIGVVIVHDQDTADCKLLKDKLVGLCNKGTFPYLVRIICRELESWYIGDFNAVEQAYPHFKAASYQNKAKFRNPDLCNACDELIKILPEFQTVSGARKISPFMSIESNRSNSFHQFKEGVRAFFEKFE